ncbi:MAG: class I adenylate-forming enzyme family protein [Acidimicrobiales bacterium]
MSETLTLSDATAALTAPGQTFEMEEVVVRDIPTRVWKQAPATLRTVLELSRGHGEADFLVYENERVSFARHYRLAATLAHRLVDRFGVQKGDRVAIAMRNLPEWVTAFWAAAVAGAVVVPLNAWWTTDELAYGIEDSGSVVVFADRERADRIQPRLGRLRGLRAMVVTDEHRDGSLGGGPGGGTDGSAVDDTAGSPPAGEPEPSGTGDGAAKELAFADVLGDVDPEAVPPDVDLGPDDDATIFYTSGTTGRPKGAVGTHRNTCTNLMNLYFFNTRSRLRFGTSMADTEDGSQAQNCYLLTVPLFHATGCHAVLITNTAVGTKLVMVHHFDPERALELIEREHVTIFGGVPTMVMRILDSPDLARRDLSSVRSISYGGAPAPPELVRRIRRAFPVGQPGNGYGLTETSAAATMNSGEDYVHKPDSVGPPSPVNDVAIVPEGFDGDEPIHLGPGAPGELWIKGPNVVRGYWQCPEETARTFTRGWIHTGDIARVDEEGFVYIVDRAKDMIIRGGENVYSVEVEDALFEHPAVADCAVIGVPDSILGEEVGAVVVLRPGTKVTGDELAEHVRQRLAAYNVPSRLWLRSEPLPHNPAGKVLKRSLRDELLSGAPLRRRTAEAADG